MLKVSVFCPCVALLAALLPATASPACAAAEVTTAPKAAPKAWDFWAHNAKRREQIAREVESLPADTTRTVVLFGDSISEGHPIKQIAGYRVINQGISGDVTDAGTTVSGLASRLEFVKKARPAHVFLMIGINDLGSSVPVDRLEKNYVALVTQLRKTVPDAKIHLESILPTSMGLAFHNANVIEMNRRIRRFARANGLDYLDLHSLMKDEKGELRAAYTDRGLHLVKPGYDVWTKALEADLARGRQ